METLSNLLRKYSFGWLVLVFLVGVLYFNVVVLPNAARVLGETDPIDLQFFYTPEKVYAMVEAYGPEVRTQYRDFALTGDIAYPIVYPLFFSLAISWLFKRGLPKDSRLHRLNVVPFGAGIFDVLENLAIAAMLGGYPAEPAWLAWIAAFFTMVKWLFVFASLALILYGGFIALKRARSGPSRGATGDTL
ncbi:MAG TPA: hypothetical protein VMN57_04720 [Anaerolineales bacterium]|nr:hypothetical protein [Anaerolineales bacterium]